MPLPVPLVSSLMSTSRAAVSWGLTQLLDIVNSGNVFDRADACKLLVPLTIRATADGSIERQALQVLHELIKHTRSVDLVLVCGDLHVAAELIRGSAASCCGPTLAWVGVPERNIASHLTSVVVVVATMLGAFHNIDVDNNTYTPAQPRLPNATSTSFRLATIASELCRLIQKPSLDDLFSDSTICEVVDAVSRIMGTFTPSMINNTDRAVMLNALLTLAKAMRRAIGRSGPTKHIAHNVTAVLHTLSYTLLCVMDDGDDDTTNDFIDMMAQYADDIDSLALTYTQLRKTYTPHDATTLVLGLVDQAIEKTMAPFHSTMMRVCLIGKAPMEVAHMVWASFAQLVAPQRNRGTSAGSFEVVQRVVACTPEWAAVETTLDSLLAANQNMPSASFTAMNRLWLNTVAWFLYGMKDAVDVQRAGAKPHIAAVAGMITDKLPLRMLRAVPNLKIDCGSLKDAIRKLRDRILSTPASNGTEPSGPDNKKDNKNDMKACSCCGISKDDALQLQRVLRCCSGCKKVRYCSAHCQKQHWQGGHKLACGSSGAA
jgi:MYND finger